VAEFETEVLVVGAGPVGLMMAVELHRHGVPCRIIERSTEASVECRALHVQSRTLEVLEHLGLAEAAMELGVRVRAENIWKDGSLLQRIPMDWDPLPDIPFPMMLNLEQNMMEALLSDHLTRLGGRVERGVALTGVAQVPESVTATVWTPDGVDHIRCRYLVGCDGSTSLVRKEMGLPFEGHPYPDTYIMADVEVEGWLAPEESHRFIRGDEVLLATPIRGSHRFRMTTRDNGPSQVSPSEYGFLGESHPPALQEMQRALDRVARPGLHLVNSRWTSHYRVSRRLASRFRKGRIFLAGDAAHLFPDAGGQGMNTGIQDAWGLAWRLASDLRGSGTWTLLGGYEVERRHVATEVAARTDRAFRTRTELVDQEAEGSPQRWMQSWAQLETNYRDLPGFEQHGSRPEQAALEAGDRAPDGRLELPGKGTLRVFDLLKGTSSHALFFFQGLELPDELARLADWLVQHRSRQVCCHFIRETCSLPPEGLSPLYCDPGGAVATSYGAQESSVFLIRPDGYVGFRADAENAGRLLGWLDRLLGPVAD